MKKLSILFACAIMLSSCAELTKVINDSGVLTEGGGISITQSEAANGLKQALKNGANTGTSFLGKTDGFLKNAAYKIIMPQEVRNVEQKIRGNAIANALAGPYLDKVVTSMNRGAENAMAEAKPIFVNAITSMSIADAIKIVTGGNGAATNYLKQKTSSQLQSKFKPVIKSSLDKVNIRDPWSKVSNGYNMVTGKNVTTDLDQYVTDKAMTALFNEIKKEEDKIRANPIARTTSLLKKVFGYADAHKS